MTRIAALYWPTSSVGGINTELRALRDEADRRGDTFHVLRSGKHKNIRPGVFSERKLIRGGDTAITIDGEAPHHPSNVQATLDFLHDNYDRVYMAYLCPHATKDYGNEPLFLPLYRDLLLPIAARLTDGYWEDYKEWGTICLEAADSVTVCQPAYAEYHAGNPKVKVARQPFSPRPSKAPRSRDLLTVWTSQWKAIKGIHRLLPHIHKIPGAVELYSNGILYYQLRSTMEWLEAVGKDYFAPEFSGVGKATFHGNIPLDQIPDVMARSWFMIDLMGIGRPKNKVYQHGSFNNTTAEALWYGSCPILHRQASKVIPEDLALFVDEAEEVPALVANPRNQSFALDPSRQKKAREYVQKHFSLSTIYRQAVLGDFS